LANIVVFGSGVQGTLFGVRLQAAGHHVTLIARGNRAEQLCEAVSALAGASGVARIVIMVNHAGGSQDICNALGAERTVLAFPGAAGSLDSGVVRAVDVSEQPTAVEADAPDVTTLFRSAGFRVSAVADMDAWLRRHAVFVTAIAGALWLADTNPRQLSADDRLLRDFILAVREGWNALDRHRIGAAPLALRAILH